MWVSLQNRYWVNALNPKTREKVYTITLGLRPSALAFDQQSGQLWVTNQGDNTVQVIDRLAGTASAPIKVGTLPRALAFAGGHVWVANFSDNTVQALDPIAGSAAASIRVGVAPRGMVFDNAHQRLWLTLGSENKVVDLDPETARYCLRRPIALGREHHQQHRSGHQPGNARHRPHGHRRANAARHPLRRRAGVGGEPAQR
jgi:YVTN family beta-propeller protein